MISASGQRKHQTRSVYEEDIISFDGVACRNTELNLGAQGKAPKSNPGAADSNAQAGPHKSTDPDRGKDALRTLAKVRRKDRRSRTRQRKIRIRTKTTTRNRLATSLGTDADEYWSFSSAHDRRRPHGLTWFLRHTPQERDEWPRSLCCFGQLRVDFVC